MHISFKDPHQSKTVILIVLGLLMVLAIYIFFQNLPIGQESSDINQKTSSEPGLFMVGEYHFREELGPTDPKPLLLYIDTSDFSTKRINIDEFTNLNFQGIHEVRPLIIDNKYKIALATYSPGKIVILGSDNMFLDDLTIEFEEEFGEDERVRAVNVGDIDSDGKEEVVVGTRPNGILKYFQFTNGKWSGTLIDELDTAIHDLLIMDSDGNGINEIIITTSMTGGQVVDEVGPDALSPRTSKILKYEFTENEWHKKVIWESETLIVEENEYTHARYLFYDDFDGDGSKEIATGVLGIVSGLDSIMLLKWNGTEYSQYSRNIMNDSLRISSHIIASGDLNNDGKSEIIAPTIMGDALLLYELEGYKWESSVLSDDLIDEYGDKDEVIISMTIFNSPSEEYKKIFYITAFNNHLLDADNGIYVLEYDPLEDIWNRKQKDNLDFSIPKSWGIFSPTP